MEFTHKEAHELAREKGSNPSVSLWMSTFTPSVPVFVSGPALNPRSTFRWITPEALSAKLSVFGFELIFSDVPSS